MSVDESQAFVYIARATCCGNVVAVVSANSEFRRFCARYVAEWIRDGLTVERITLQAFRGIEMHCCTCAEKAQAEQAELAI